MSKEIDLEMEDAKVREFFSRMARHEEVLLQYGDRLFQLKLRSVPLSASAVDFLRKGGDAEKT